MSALAFLMGLIATIIIEFIVYLIAVRKNVLRLLFYSLLINALTNPLANMIYEFGAKILLVEIGVVVIEIFLIKKLLEVKYWKAVIIAIIANVLSFVAGLVWIDVWSYYL